MKHSRSETPANPIYLAVILPYVSPKNGRVYKTWLDCKSGY
jgi:hypothetical protein